jgi:queuine tRNA-ribosyltransferase
MSIFKIAAKDKNSKARAGTIITAHGEISTPIFMPVGTQGAVKGIHHHEIKEIVKADVILSNTYHMYLRPGTEILEKAGGIHQYIGWDRPLLTDSGGYQVYSLSGMRKIKEEGVKFQSHIDGSYHHFSPESVMDIQRKIGADIIMAFDECTPYPCEYNYARKSMHMTHRWLDRCIEQLEKSPLLYGYDQVFAPIVQGSTYKDLREESANFIASRNQKINAIGGLSVGEPHEDMYAMTELVCNILPEDKPRYLMGVGLPENILESITLGIDMMDCVLPTRNARHGIIYTPNGIINIHNNKWKEDLTPLDEAGIMEYPVNHSKSYIRHLFKAGEALGPQIASIYNLTFFIWLVREARVHIEQGNFYEWKTETVKKVAIRM